MEKNKQNADFLNIGKKLLDWYAVYGRDLPFRNTKNPYKIWICEIVFQQTRISQGLGHYIKFIERFPDVETLATADTDEVLLHWKGLGYYSRAMNVHKAAQQIIQDYNGVFPSDYEDIIKLKGVGKYTAAAIASICFGGDYPAVDGNFYRVLSRFFGDDYDISRSGAHQYFWDLSLRIMPQGRAGDFNQAMMDLGSEVCKPKSPVCMYCPINEDCVAYATGTTEQFPVKNKRTETKELSLKYYFIAHQDTFLARRRGTDFIWKNLYEFATEIPKEKENSAKNHIQMKHKLTHRNLTIDIYYIDWEDFSEFETFAKNNNFLIISKNEAEQKSFPKPLQDYIEKYL